jgi:UDP-N-acetylglucosamine 2-epimerase (non-hydrolysing)
VRLVVGTRPEAIKLKPVVGALAACGIAPSLIFTGQHPALDPREFGLDRVPRQLLGCPGDEGPHAHVRAVTEALLALLRNRPDLIVVQGDTSSAYGGALAAFRACIPVAHVEAALRTHDPLLPWPEEEYRTAIEAGAELLFAPTETAAANLRAEGVPGEIHVTGNSGIDALLEAAARLPARRLRDSAMPRLLVTCHRRESWRDGLTSIAAALVELAGHGAEIDFVLHPNEFVAASMRRLLDGVRGVHLLAPCSQQELLGRMRDSDLVLSDSGGIQEEAPALGVPLLILRDKTERPEGIAAGSSLLVGTDQSRIVSEARRLLDDPIARAAMSRPVFPFGDGRTGARIAAIIETWLENRAASVGRRVTLL